MIALVRYSGEPPLRRLSRLRAKNSVDCAAVPRFGVRALEITLRRTVRAPDDERLLDLAAERIRAAGLVEAVCSCGELERELASRGVAAPPLDRLLDRCMAEAAIFALDALRPSSVGVYALRRSPELERTVRALVPRVRSLALCLERDGERYARELAYDCGAPVTLGRAALRSRELKILFDEPDFPVGAGAAIGKRPPPQAGLRVAAGYGFSLSARFLGGGYPPELLASAAAGVGALARGEVGVSAIRFANSIDNPPTNHYNSV